MLRSHVIKCMITLAGETKDRLRIDTFSMTYLVWDIFVMSVIKTQFQVIPYLKQFMNYPVKLLRL